MIYPPHLEILQYLPLVVKAQSAPVDKIAVPMAPFLTEHLLASFDQHHQSLSKTKTVVIKRLALSAALAL